MTQAYSSISFGQKYNCISGKFKKKTILHKHCLSFPFYSYKYLKDLYMNYLCMSMSEKDTSELKYYYTYG